jgi:beta-N-acetylhexosaminidase
MRSIYYSLFIILFSNVVYANSTELSRAAGQMMLVGFGGTAIDEHSSIVKEIKKYHIGGVILDYTNVNNPAQLKRLTSQLQFYAKKYHDYPLFIALNQEGGLINTIKPSQGFNNKDDPSQFELGKTNNQKRIYDSAYKRALLLKEYGINLNLAPVADLNINPNNPAIGKLRRSFGDDVNQVTEDLLSSINAYKKANVFCTLKHFPGLGSATKNTDYHDTDLTNTWTNKELLPYQNLIQKDNICQFVMSSHLINANLDKNNLPASLSKSIITDLLIKKLHFQGIVITDDMDAAAIRQLMPAKTAIKKAVLAGNNIILYGGTQDYNPYDDAELLYNTLITLSKNNPTIYSQIIKSSHKILKLKKILITLTRAS